jgi:hypothetical protein
MKEILNERAVKKKEKTFRKVWRIQKMFVPLHPQKRGK